LFISQQLLMLLLAVFGDAVKSFIDRRWFAVGPERHVESRDVRDVIAMSSVKVAVRVRPFNSRELTRECGCIIAMTDNTTGMCTRASSHSLPAPHTCIRTYTVSQKICPSLLLVVLFFPRKRGSMFLPALICVSVCVCLCVCDHDN